MEKIKLLDHGHIGLVDSMGGDLAIVRNARVSYDAEWRAGEDKGSDHRLINYLYSNGHNTPFEAVYLTFDVMAPIFVFRQWHRHRTQSYNELSARYKELPEKFYIPEAHLIGKQNADNKQMRDPLTREEYEVLHYAEKAIIENTQALMLYHGEEAFQKYRSMITDGVPRELARSVLPVSTYSHMFASMNLNNAFKFLAERLHPHAQYEIRVYAEAMLELIEPVAPVACEAFKKSIDYDKNTTK